MLTRWVDELYPDRRRIFTGKTNPESTLNRSQTSGCHGEYQPVKSPDVLGSAVRYCINGKIKLSAIVLTRLCGNITNLPWRQNAERDALREEVARLNLEIRRQQMELDILKKAKEIKKNLWSPPFLPH